MRTSIATTIAVLFATVVTTSAHGTVLGDIPSASFDVLDGKVTESIVVSGVTDNGVSADLTFTFTANTGTLDEGNRLGINSAFNQGSSGANAVNEGETIELEVSALVTNVPAAHKVTALNFGISTIDLVRAGPSNGSNGYVWNSSAGNFVSPLTSQTGDQSVETMDGASVFDILSTNYTATFNVDEDGDTDVSGFRWLTDVDNVHFSFEATTVPFPEPGSFALAVLGMLSLGTLRRRRTIAA